MHQGRYVFAQLFEYLPMHVLRRAVQRYQGERYAKRFSCHDQFLCMAFAQLSARQSLRDIEICLRAHQAKLYHLGIRGRVARSTLADANERRDWHIYEELAQYLIRTARQLYVDEPLAGELSETTYALDSTTIELCLSTFPWARAMHPGRGGIKLHTLLDVRGSIPTMIHLSESRRHDVNALDLIIPEAGAIYLMDRAYLDFMRLYQLHCTGAFFVMRAKHNFRFKRRYSHPVKDRNSIVCDQTVVLARDVARNAFPAPLRRVRVRDVDAGGSIVLLTNHFGLSADTVSALYRHRWQVEIFFKWVKQHLRIKAFFGTSINAVQTQIWIAVAVYVLIAIVRKQLEIEASLYKILQILSVTLFEQIALKQILTDTELQVDDSCDCNQLNLFDY